MTIVFASRNFIEDPPTTLEKQVANAYIISTFPSSWQTIEDALMTAQVQAYLDGGEAGSIWSAVSGCYGYTINYGYLSGVDLISAVSGSSWDSLVNNANPAATKYGLGGVVFVYGGNPFYKVLLCYGYDWIHLLCFENTSNKIWSIKIIIWRMC